MGMRAFLLSLLLALSAIAVAFAMGDARQKPSDAATAAYFVFDRPFWLNLHHFLYVLGRAELRTPDSQRRAVAGAPADMADGLGALDDGEQRVWRAAVSFYARSLSTKEVLFDGEMVAIGRALVAAGNRPALDSIGLDAKVVDTLRRAAPLYRKAWWPRHEHANGAFVDRLQALIAQHGEAVRAFITRAYGQKWPQAGFPISITAYANWAGAFSTSAGLIVISSRDPGAEGLKALESVFHEAMHQWDDAVDAMLIAQARRQGATVPDNLSHAMIFFTAGQAVRSVNPGYVPYAEAEGVWARGMGTLRPALEAAWQPYLAGQGSRDEALAALLKAAAGNPR
jgi:hypothetical protein